ncbi:MAG: hypothetical protein HZC02_05665 [Candidatus Levybacteria bacterium]|nr:hypothetical protein [Candidatus Levybacteria bacterium]
MSSVGCAVTKVGSPQNDAPSLPKDCSDGTIQPGTGQPGQPLPSNDTTQIKEELCTQYKVCPTESPLQPPNGAWTLAQLTALWNLVQKIYMSPTYKTLAIGNYQLELTRARCYPGGCDNTWGYYAGQVYPGWGKISGARLIVITDNINLAQSQLVMEWLFAHEIGHSASGGLPDGSLAGSLGENSAYKNVQSCGSIVSNYGYTNWNENNSEILAFYMTAGEEAIGGYLGANKNLAQDYTCVYNMAKQHYFNGIEY